MLSYPFTSQVTYDDYGQPLYDRAVDSEFLRKVFLQYFSDGVFYKPTNALQVVVDTGMQVAVEPGACHIRGAMGIEESRRTLVVQASEEQDRIDTVVARLDLSTAVRSIDLYVVKGTAAVSPQAPELTRDATVWEIGLANIFVAKNTATISQQRITDTRLDTTRCGIVVQTIGDVDTSPYFAQLAAAIATHQEEAEAQIQVLKDAIAAVEGDTAWMMQDVYDPRRKRRDVFKYAEHPVGYIFSWAPVDDDPTDLSTAEKVAEYYGYGTWKEITGAFLFGRDEQHQAGSTGGEAEHTLTKDELPNEKIPINVVIPNSPEDGAEYARFSYTGYTSTDSAVTLSGGFTGPLGSGQAHNNMPPYLTVYMWQRIA